MSSLSVSTSAFGSHFILVPGLEGSFLTIVKIYWDFLPTHSMGMFKLLKQLNSSNRIKAMSVSIKQFIKTSNMFRTFQQR